MKAAIEKLCDLHVSDIRLIKDKTTNTSRGFCFVELSSVEVGLCMYIHISQPPVSVQEATGLLEIVQKQYPAFFIDGRRGMHMLCEAGGGIACTCEVLIVPWKGGE